MITRGRTARRRLAAVLVALVTTALAASLLAVPSPARAEAPATAKPSAPTAPVPARLKNFPQLPARCVDDKGTICRITRYPGRPFVVLWGDSHAVQYLAPVRTIAQRRRVNVVVIFAGGCPLSLPFPAGSGHPRLSCDKHNERALAYVRGLHRSGKKVRVILGSWWSFYRRLYALVRYEDTTGQDIGLTDYQRHITRLAVERSPAMFRAIGRAGIRADVLGQSGEVPDDAAPCALGENPYRCDLPRSQVLPQYWDNRRWLRDTLSSLLSRRPRVIDTSPVYCGATTCRGRARGTNTFSDDDHLGMGLTRTMRPLFRPTFEALARQ